MAKKEIIVKESSEVIVNCDNLPQGVVESLSPSELIGRLV